jgi:hypothetical protein
MFMLNACVIAAIGALGLTSIAPTHAATLRVEPVASATAVVAVASDTLGYGAGGVLTRDGAAAYIEALEFVLAQMGKPMSFNAQARQQIEQGLATLYPQLPAQAQASLAQARTIWTEYRTQWDGLDLDTRRAFAYDVLALAVGEQAAAKALGMSPQSASSSASSGGSDDYRPTVDDLMGSVPGSDCWASAGCVSYDSSTNTYTYE